MSEVFDVFFTKDDKSDYKVAEELYRVVSSIRKGEDELYQTTLKRCAEKLKLVRENMNIEKDSEDEDDMEEEEEQRDYKEIEMDLEKFKKKKKNKMEVEIDKEFVKNVKFEEDSDDEWETV